MSSRVFSAYAVIGSIVASYLVIVINLVVQSWR